MQQVYWGELPGTTPMSVKLTEQRAQVTGAILGKDAGSSEMNDRRSFRDIPAALGKQASYTQPHIPFQLESLQVSVTFLFSSLVFSLMLSLSFSLLNCFLWQAHLSSAVLANFNYTVQCYQLRSPGWESLSHSPLLYSQLSFFRFRT